MLEVCQSIDRSRVSASWFVTLTVPTQDECSYERIEQHRRAWVKRLERRWRGHVVGGVWKKEPHKSGWPHLHIMLWWVSSPPDLDEFRVWNDDAWASIVRSVNPRHRVAGCRVEVMQHWNGVVSYCAKYIGKRFTLGASESVKTGRIWGWFHRSALPVRIVERQLSPRTGKRAQRVLRKLQQRKRERWFVWSGIDRCWWRLRDGFQPVLEKGLWLTARDAAARIKAEFGVRVKRVRPKCGSLRLDYAVSVEGFDRTVRHERLEPTFFAPAVAFVSSAEVSRLVECLERLEAFERSRAPVPI